MFTDETDLTLNSNFSGEHNTRLLPFATRVFLTKQYKSVNLNDGKSLNDNALLDDDILDLNNMSYDDYLRYIGEYGRRNYLMCIRCGKRVYPLDDDYDSSIIEEEEPHFLCSDCENDMENELKPVSSDDTVRLD